MILLKVLVAIVAGVIGLFAALFGLASGVARNTSDPVERKHATFTAFWSLIVFALCAGAIVTLSGCSDARALYHACRDGLCR